MRIRQAFVTGTGAIGTRPPAFQSQQTCTPSAPFNDVQHVAQRNVARVSMLSSVYAQIDDAPRRRNTELNVSTNTSRLDAVRKQVEFWFSPSNLRHDSYLRRQMDNDGWMDPAVFLKFNRLQQLHVSLAELVDACRHSDLVEVSQPPEEGVSFGDDIRQTRIRPSAEIPSVLSEETATDAESCLVVESLPENSTVESIRDMFLPHGAVTNTWLSKPTPKDPEVYAIIGFESAASATSALNAFVADQPANLGPMTVTSKALWENVRYRERSKSVIVEVSGLSHTVMWRDLWNEMNELLQTHDLTMSYFLYRNGDPNCFITLADETSAKKLLEEVFATDPVIAGCQIRARVLSDKAELEEYWQNASARMIERKKRNEKFVRGDFKPFDQLMTSRRGLVISIEGLPVGCGWKQLLSELKVLGPVVFLNLESDATKCYVRLKDAETAAVVAAKLNEPDPVILLGTQVTAMVIEGDEEEEYWKNASQELRKKKLERKVSVEETRKLEDSVQEDYPVSPDMKEYGHSFSQPELATRM